jgi:hypothetical protein
MAEYPIPTTTAIGHVTFNYGSHDSAGSVDVIAVSNGTVQIPAFPWSDDPDEEDAYPSRTLTMPAAEAFALADLISRAARQAAIQAAVAELDSEAE